MKQSHTTVLERNTEWRGRFETEPYEVGWAGEAIFFLRVLEASARYIDADAQVQISPDGIHWANEWSTMSISADGSTTYCRVSHFGAWLRLVGELPEGETVKVLVYLVLKE